MENLTKFLYQLSFDKKLQENFASDPDKVMNNAGLSDQQKQAILSKDSDKISEAIANENKTSNLSNAKWTILVLITIKF